MDEYVHGSAAALNDLYRLISLRLLGYHLRLIRDHSRAEDLMQITFAKVHRSRSSYLRGAPLMPWILAIARCSFLDKRRSARVRNENLTRDGSLPEPPPSERGVPNDPSEALDRALDTLPSAYRQAIQLEKGA